MAGARARAYEKVVRLVSSLRLLLRLLAVLYVVVIVADDVGVAAAPLLTLAVLLVADWLSLPQLYLNNFAEIRIGI
jgi:hypothetical protein